MQFSNFCYLESNKDNQEVANEYDSFCSLFAIGSLQMLNCNYENAFEKLQAFWNETNNDWIFGNFLYDIKNGLERLTSENFDALNYSDLNFFQPKYLFAENEKGFYLYTFDETSKILEEIENSSDYNTHQNSTINLIPKVNFEEYNLSFQKIIREIQLGNIYEMNFCFEYFAENASINIIDVWQKLNKLSLAPMSCLYKTENNFIISASPERFLKKKGNNLIAQPIKGTAKRSKHKTEDANLLNELKNNIKEQSENVMIVDLVRNDLSKVAKKGSVKVTELFGAYSFKQVHQLISTICCEVDSDKTISEILTANFPMGSMTGAPKIKAMQLIEHFEITKRGAYSGSVGYIDPNGDFDFNVIIRSLLYNSEKKYLSYSVGSAITIAANAKEEYQECLLKAKVIQDLF